MEQWTYPSKSGLGEYTVTMTDGGALTCNCKGWSIKKPGKPRECTHIKDVFDTQGFVREVRGDYVFAKLFGHAGLTPPPDVDIIIGEGEATMATATATILEGMKASAMTDAKYAHLTDGMGRTIPAKFDAAFATGEWTMDEKLDGHRCLVRVANGKVTTPLRSVTLPTHIVTPLSLMPDGVYDGELLVPGGVSTDVPNLACRNELIFAVFDILECNGTATMTMPWTERRMILDMALQFAPGQTAVVMVAEFEPSWAEVERIWARGGEGVILKRKTSVYRPGHRSPDWLKVKALEHHTVTVIGFEAGSLGPTAVVLFKFDDGTEGRCKNLNNDELAASSANPAAYVGRRLVVQCQQRMRGSKSPRHPMMKGYEFDHLAGEAE
jgi:hypothetical protein